MRADSSRSALKALLLKAAIVVLTLTGFAGSLGLPSAIAAPALAPARSKALAATNGTSIPTSGRARTTRREVPTPTADPAVIRGIFAKTGPKAASPRPPKSALKRTSGLKQAIAPSACTVPGAPATVTVTVGTNSVKATWTAAADNGTPLTAYIATAVVGTVSGPAVAVTATTLSATVTGLRAAVSTTIAVTAVSSCGEGPARTSSAVTPTGNATTYASAVVTSSPSVYYRLGESADLATAADSSGHHYHLDYAGAGTLASPGALGTGDPDFGVSADGGCCVATGSATLPQFDAARSVEAWVKPLDGYGRWFAGWGHSDTDQSFDVGLEDSTILVDAYDDQLSFSAGRSLVDGVWHHVAVTYDGVRVSAYLDGLSIGSKTFATSLDTVNDAGMVVGAYANGGGAFYGGLDEVAVYPSALSSSTVAAHFAASGYARPKAPVVASGSDGADNEAVVSWSVGAVTTPPITRYVVTAILGTTRQTSVVVAGNKTAARVTGLAGGSSYTFAVAAGNAYGLGPEVITTAVPITGTATAYAATVASDGPSVFYRLGESAAAAFGADSSGKGHLLQYAQVDLQASGAIATDIDKAATADGGCCLGTGHPVLPAYNTARTAEFWVKPSDTQGRWDLGWGRSETEMAFEVGTADSSIIVSGYDDDLTFPTPRPLNDGSWHQVDVVYDGTRVTAYLDGVSIGVRTFVNPLDTLDESGLVVGAAHNGESPAYGGLDEIAVYPIALAASRVQAHFAASGHAVPAAPTSVAASASANSVSATWAAPTGTDPLTAYQVTALTSAGTVASALAVSGSATSAKITGLPGGAAYTVRVVGTNAYGSGAASVSTAVTPTGSSTTYASTVLAQSPSAYYRLGEAASTSIAAESSGRGRPLTISRGAFGAGGAIAGDPNTAVTADGGCCVGFVAAAALPGYNATRSVEVWVKPNDTQGRWILGWGSNDTDAAFNVGIQDSRVLVDSYGDGLSFQAARSMVDGSWHQVVVTYDGTSVRAYLDGVALGTKPFTNPIDTVDATTLRLGAFVNGGSPFYGGIDDVAIYPTALTAAQVTAHFVASGHGVPGAVTGITAVAGANTATVSWAAPVTSDGVDSYVMTALNAGVPGVARSIPGTVTSASLTGLTAGTAYTIRVVPRNVYGDGAVAVSAAVTPTGSATTYASSVLANAPSAYYRLGDGVGTTVGADSSGKGHPLTYDQATLGAGGALSTDADRSVTANGSCCVGTAAISALPATNSARTVEAWVQPLDSNGRWFVGWGASATRRGFSVGVQGDAVIVSSYSDDLTLPIGHSIVDGAWHFIVVTYTGSSVYAYVDGVALANKTFTAALHTTPNTQLVVGAHESGSSPFYGGLDELAIYPTAFTAAQVSAHFAASGQGPPPALTGLGVTARPNGVAVSWLAPPAASQVTRITVTAVSGTTAQNALVVAGNATSATLGGLAGGATYTIRVTATNSRGTGPPATSAPIVPTGAATTYATAVLSQAPIAYYRLGEASGLSAAADSSGRAGVLATTDGTFGAAGAIVGDTDTAVTGDGGCCIGSATAPLPAFNAARSVEAWVKPTDASGRWLVGWGTNATGRAFDVGVQGDSILVAGYSDDVSFPVGRSLVDGAWHHVVVTYDGATAIAYVDGVSLGTRTFAVTLNTVTNGFLRVGAAVAGDSAVYGGLDEVSIYSSALSAAQVAAHYAAAGHAAPGAPTAVAATARTNGVSVTWTPPTAVDGITRYVVTVLRAGVPINATGVAGSASSAVITGLPASTAVTVRVVAGNSYGDSPAGVSAAVTPTGTLTTTYASAVIADGPIAYYRLGEAAGVAVGADSSGKAGLLTYSRATLATAGALPHDTDTAVTADGGCCIGPARASLLPRYNSARSLEAWVKPSDASGRWIAGWGATATNRAFDVGIDDTDVLASEYSGDLTFPIGHSLLDGAWHHIVVTYDGTSAKAYVDGVALGSQTFPSALNTATSSTIEIGGGSEGSSPSYGGIDDVAIYPTALTAAQVAAHYAAR